MNPAMQSEYQARLSQLRAALADKPLRRKDMARLLDVSEDTVYRYLKILRDVKEVHVGRWERNTEGGQPFAWFAAGDKPDAPKPRPLTNSEQGKRYYRKMKRDDPAKYTAYLSRARVRVKMRRRESAGKPPVPADPMLAWIPRRAA